MYTFGPAADQKRHRVYLYIVSKNTKTKLYLYRSLFENTEEKVGIHCNNIPLTISAGKKHEFYDENVPNLILIYVIGSSVSLLGSLCITFVISDRESKLKEIQHAAGVSIYMYWGITFIWDFLSYCIYIMVFLIPTFFLHIPGHYNYEIIAEFTLLFAYGLFLIPFIYLVSLKFSDVYVGYFSCVLLNILLGLYNYVVITGFFSAYKSKLSALDIYIPPISMLLGYSKINRVVKLNQFCKEDQEYLNIGYNFLCDIEENRVCCG